MGLIPIFHDIEKEKSLLKLFGKGLLLGWLVMAYFHRWILELQFWTGLFWATVLWLLFSFYLALFYGAGITLYGVLRNRGLSSALLFPSCWVAFEWIRSLGPIGNPAGVLGYSQALNIPILQFASLGGVFGISFLCVLVNTGIYLGLKSVSDFIRYKGHPQRISTTILPAIASIGLLFAVYVWGYQRVLSPKISLETRKAAVIQGNHTQDAKLSEENWDALREDYLDLLSQTLSPTIDYIVLPETITPSLNLQKTSFMEHLLSLLKNHQATVIFGTPYYDGSRYYNAAASVTQEGLHPDIFKKVKLMPFGEYWPMKWFFRLVGLENIVPGADYSPGESAIPVSLPKHKIGIGICLESLYPWHFRSLVQKKNVQFFCVLSNSAWYFNSAAAEEHLYMNVFRSVENNRYILQSANVGISAIINNFGQIQAYLPLYQKGVVSGEIDVSLRKTLYTRTGEWGIIGLSFILMGIGTIFFYRHTKKF